MVKTVDSEQRLFTITKSKNGEKTVVYYEQLFDILHRSHIENTGHGGRNLMRQDLKDYHGIGEYDNIYIY
jgi:hypothetical protein